MGVPLVYFMGEPRESLFSQTPGFFLSTVSVKNIYYPRLCAAPLVQGVFTDTVEQSAV